jgi:hypothetical protein
MLLLFYGAQPAEEDTPYVFVPRFIYISHRNRLSDT